MTRTSQLQIRISPQEKATLKHLAALEGKSVSAYVLSRALPSTGRAMDAVLSALRTGAIPPTGAAAALVRLVEAMDPAGIADVLSQADVTDLPPVTQNYVAGVVEHLARVAELEAPDWTRSVTGLERPHFRWPLRSLRPYQLRTSPLALKRRNLFDPTVRLPARAPNDVASLAPPLAKCLAVSQHLQSLELDVEFYFVGGLSLAQLYPGRPRSARPRDLFGMPEGTLDPLGTVAAAQAWPEGWLDDTVRQLLRPSGQIGHFEDLGHVRVFVPPPAYALAVHLASRRGPSRDDDLRRLLRALNVTAAPAALAAVGQYFSERQLPPDTPAVLQGLLGQ